MSLFFFLIKEYILFSLAYSKPVLLRPHEGLSRIPFGLYGNARIPQLNAQRAMTKYTKDGRASKQGLGQDNIHFLYKTPRSFLQPNVCIPGEGLAKELGSERKAPERIPLPSSRGEKSQRAHHITPAPWLQLPLALF